MQIPSIEVGLDELTAGLRTHWPSHGWISLSRTWEGHGWFEEFSWRCQQTEFLGGPTGGVVVPSHAGSEATEYSWVADTTCSPAKSSATVAPFRHISNRKSTSAASMVTPDAPIPRAGTREHTAPQSIGTVIGILTQYKSLLPCASRAQGPPFYFHSSLCSQHFTPPRDKSEGTVFQSPISASRVHRPPEHQRAPADAVRGASRRQSIGSVIRAFCANQALLPVRRKDAGAARWWGKRWYFPKLIPQRDEPRWGLSSLPKCISEVGASASGSTRSRRRNRISCGS